MPPIADSSQTTLNQVIEQINEIIAESILLLSILKLVVLDQLIPAYPVFGNNARFMVYIETHAIRETPK